MSQWEEIQCTETDVRVLQRKVGENTLQLTWSKRTWWVSINGTNVASRYPWPMDSEARSATFSNPGAARRWLQYREVIHE